MYVGYTDSDSQPLIHVITGSHLKHSAPVYLNLAYIHTYRKTYAYDLICDSSSKS